MNTIKRIVASLLIFITLLFTMGITSNAEGSLNTFEKEFTYSRAIDGKTFGAYVTIKSSREADWNLTFDTKNDNPSDEFVYYRLTADGDPGDVIDISVTSEYPDTLLGVTVLPKINGNWKTGTQKTLFVKEDDNTITDSVTIGDDVSDLQVSVSAYSKAFSSKKPGSMDIILTIETPAHVDAAPATEGGGKFFLTIVAAVLFLVVLTVILGKRSADKLKKESK